MPPLSHAKSFSFTAIHKRCVTKLIYGSKKKKKFLCLYADDFLVYLGGSLGCRATWCILVRDVNVRGDIAQYKQGVTKETERSNQRCYLVARNARYEKCSLFLSD